jgi:hypothetical protein
MQYLIQATAPFNDGFHNNRQADRRSRQHFGYENGGAEIHYELFDEGALMHAGGTVQCSFAIELEQGTFDLALSKAFILKRVYERDEMEYFGDFFAKIKNI